MTTFLNNKKEIINSLITRENGKYKIISGQGPLLFNSIKELVNHFIKIGLFKKPFKNKSSIFVENKKSNRRNKVNETLRSTSLFWE